MSPGQRRARAIVDLSAFREADALLHVVRAFNADDIPHVSETVDPGRDARAVEDELILADLSVAEKRLERIERDRRKGASKELDREAELLERCRARLEEGLPIRGLDLDPTAAKTLRGFQFLSVKPLLLVINLDEANIHEAERAAELANLSDILEDTRTRAVGVCAKIELEIAQLESGDAEAFMADLGLDAPGLEPRDQRGLRPAGLHLLLYSWRGRVSGVVDSQGNEGPTGCRRGPHRHRAGLHSGRGRRMRAPAAARLDRRLSGQG